MTARGIRNNNPGNIRHSKDKWQGMADEQKDTEFVTFRSPEFGLRAIARVLLTYQKRGLNTIGEIVGAYAPPSENNTAAYINSVCSQVGYGSLVEIDVDNYEVMKPLVEAIIRHETGASYPDSVIDAGLRLAGIHGAAPKPLVKSKTMAGSAATAAGGVLAAAAEVSRQVREVQDVVQPGVDFVQGLVSYGPWAAAGITVAAAGWIAWSRYQDRVQVGH